MDEVDQQALVYIYAAQVLLQTVEPASHLLVNVVFIAHVLNRFYGLDELFLQFFVLAFVLFVVSVDRSLPPIVRLDQVGSYRTEVLPQLELVEQGHYL